MGLTVRIFQEIGVSVFKIVLPGASSRRQLETVFCGSDGSLGITGEGVYILRVSLRPPVEGFLLTCSMPDKDRPIAVMPSKIRQLSGLHYVEGRVHVVRRNNRSFVGQGKSRVVEVAKGLSINRPGNYPAIVLKDDRPTLRLFYLTERQGQIFLEVREFYRSIQSPDSRWSDENFCGALPAIDREIEKHNIKFN